MLERPRRLLPGLWAGFLVCVALVATPSAFSTLPQADAARVVARVLASEAYASLAFGVVLLVLERLVARGRAGANLGSQFTVGMVLALGALFCTVAGYFAVQPVMAAARAGQGPLSFGQLHAVSAAFYILKVGLVLALAWRVTRAASEPE